jgi:bifunctional non-homologous end joining protein LigD
VSIVKPAGIRHFLFVVYACMGHQRTKSKQNSKDLKAKKLATTLPANSSRKRKKQPIVIDAPGKQKDLSTIIQFAKRKCTHSVKASFPHDLKPMLATLTENSFTNSDWQFEIKWDGYRALAYVNKGKVQLRSRNNINFNQKYAAVYEALKTWNVNAVVDGEIVVVNEQGKADFNSLQQWQFEQNGQLLFYVFDLLYLDGLDITNEPLTTRREILRDIMLQHPLIRFSESIDEFGEQFFEIAKQNELEGIIAKKKDSIYQTGSRSKAWLKIKVQQRQEAVICGYTKKKDTDREFSSLILGLYEDDVLKYAGNVGTGWNDEMQKQLLGKMSRLVTKKCPLEKEPALADYPVWIHPFLVAEIKYTERTSEGAFRHPVFLGLREDKLPIDVHEDEIINEIEPTNEKEKDNLVNTSEEEALVTINEQELKLTNLKKIYWPKEKITKGDLINYYHQMAPYIMPYMKDRPQSLNRFPNGITGESFYQKNMSGKVDKWIKTFRRVSASSNEAKDFLICTDEATLIYLANLGCIEMNPWHSRVQTPHYPDWSVIDLDPGNISFEKVIETAIVVKKVLDALQVPSYPKTSGSTGIHIYVPLGAKYNYEQSKQFAELIANIVHHELPAFTSVIRNPEKRKDKIYIDYLQNRPIQTICAPYSVRPKPGATVSTPLHWSEVKKGLKLQQFTIKNIFKRVKAEGDLFSGVLERGIDLNDTLKKLSALIQ